jgi:hypothetical protein
MQKVNQSTEEQLKLAREAGLTEARENFAVCPHGKVAEMDVFSWVNPDVDALDAMIAAMPYKVIWAATLEQAIAFWKLNGKGIQSIQTLVIYDSGHVDTLDWFTTFESVVCVEGPEHALELLDKLRKKKRVFIWTLPRDNWKSKKTLLENHLLTWK